MKFIKWVAEQFYALLNILPATLFVALLLIGIAAGASASEADLTRGDSFSGLPVRVPVPPTESGITAGWDIDGDDRPDMIQVTERGLTDAKAHIETAYDFDGDGKPDFVRGANDTSLPIKRQEFDR